MAAVHDCIVTAIWSADVPVRFSPDRPQFGAASSSAPPLDLRGMVCALAGLGEVGRGILGLWINSPWVCPEIVRRSRPGSPVQPRRKLPGQPRPVFIRHLALCNESRAELHDLASVPTSLACNEEQ